MNLSPYFSQSKFPESTTAPPTAFADPSIYFVVECTTISTPHLKGLQNTGVGKVLSTISGTPCSCATFANFSISSTFNDGFAIVSPKTSFVLGLNLVASSSAEISGSTKVDSIPILFIVLAIRLYVPPYIAEDAIT